MNRRLKVGEKVEGISALVVELRKQRGLTAAGGRAERLRWLSELRTIMSGLPYDQRKWLTYVGGAAAVCAVGAVVLTKQPLAARAGAVLGGVLLPLGVLKSKAGNRATAALAPPAAAGAGHHRPLLGRPATRCPPPSPWWAAR